MMLAEHFLLSNKRARQNIVGDCRRSSVCILSQATKSLLYKKEILYASYSNFLLYKVYLFIALGLMCREEVSM